MAPTGVKVDSGVNELGGVRVKVAVEVNIGTANAVCVDAASAVCTIKVLIALGSSGATGTGVAMDGTHAMIKAKVVNRSKVFFPGACMFIHSNQVYGPVVGVSVGVSDGTGVRLSVGVGGMSVSVGMITSVGGLRVGVRVGVGVSEGVGVGRLMVRKTRFSA